MATAEQYAEWIVANQDKKGTPEFNTVAEAYRLAKGQTTKEKSQQELYREEMQRYQKQREGMTNPEIIGSDFGYRAIKGAPALLSGMAQSAGEFYIDPLLQQIGYDKTGLPYPGDWVTKQIQTANELKRRGLEKRGEKVSDLDPAELVGSIVGPGAVSKTVGPVANALIGKMFTHKGIPLAASKMQQYAPNLLERMATGSAGAGLWATGMPTERIDPKAQSIDPMAKVEQAVPAMMFGAGIPVVGAVGHWGAKGIGQLFRPRNEKGITKDIIDLIRQKIGDEKTRVLLALNQKGDKTAGQAIAAAAKGADEDFGSAIVRLEKDLTRKMPEGGALRETYLQQGGARRGYMEKLAGTEDEYTKAVAARKSGTQELKDAYMRSQGTVDTIPVVQRIEKWISDNPHNEKITVPLKKVLKKIMGKADVPKESYKGVPATLRYQNADLDKYMGVETNVKNLASVVDDMGNMLKAKTPSGQNEVDVEVVNDVRKLLINQMGKPLASPEYAAYRAKYKELSAPINKMDVSRAILDKMTAPTGKEAPGTYLKALKEGPKTVAKATGFKRAKSLGDYYSADEIKKLKGIADEFETMLKQRQMESGVEPMLKTLESGIEITIPNLLSRPALIANAALRYIGKDRAPEYHRIASELMKNPQKLKELLLQPSDTVAGRVARELYNDVLPQISGITSGQMGGQ